METAALAGMDKSARGLLDDEDEPLVESHYSVSISDLYSDIHKERDDYVSQVLLLSHH